MPAIILLILVLGGAILAAAAFGEKNRRIRSIRLDEKARRAVAEGRKR